MADEGAASENYGDPLIGTSLDGYLIEEKVGEGGMGVVYRANDLGLRRQVAVKTLFLAAANQERRHRFEREARVAAGISHPNVVQVFDFGVAEGHLYLVMQLVDGPDLSHLIASAPIELNRALRLFRDVSRGLHKVHSSGLVHRDIKPSNVLIQDLGTPDERAMITDFGIARDVETQTALTVGPIGTPEYMAPETATERATERADQYALALVLYEMLAGEHLFVGQNMANAHREEPVPDLDKQLPGTPGALRAALARALDKEPARRFGSVEAFAENALRPEPAGQAPPLEALMERVLEREFPRGLSLDELTTRINELPEGPPVKAAQIDGRTELFPQLFRRRPDGKIALRHAPDTSSS